MKAPLSQSSNLLWARNFIWRFFLFLNILYFLAPGTLSAGTKPLRGKPREKSIKKAISPPTISYSSPQTYTIGAPITPLAPSATGVDVSGYSMLPVNVSGGYSSATGVSVDAAGNIYVCDQNAHKVYKIPAGGGQQTIIGTGFVQPMNCAIDAAGNVFVADFGDAKVKEILASDGSTVILPVFFNSASGIAIDKTGNLYVCELTTGNLIKVPAGTTNRVIISGFTSPYDVAVDGSGNLFVSEYSGTILKEILVGATTPVAYGSGFGRPTSIVVDAAGNVFVADQVKKEIFMIPAGNGTPIVVGPVLSGPTGVALDAAGSVYYVQGSSSPTLDKLQQIGGYYATPFLPAGLKFNSNTGVISGTPTALATASQYTVTAFNSTGSTSTSVTLAVVPMTLSYASQQAFIKGTAILPFSPSSTGVASQGYSNALISYGTGIGLNSPRALAVDLLGNVYICDYTGNKVLKTTPGGITSSLGGFNGPDGVAADAVGNVYISCYGSNTIVKLPTGGGAATTICTTIIHPYGLTCNAAGDVFVADYSGFSIQKIATGTTTATLVRAGFTGPLGVAIDPAGNLYVGDSGAGPIKKIPADMSANVLLGSGFNNPYGVAVDPSGNVFVADAANTAAKEILVGGGVSTLNNVFGLPTGIALDAAGNVYVADYQNSAIKKIVPVGGYYLNTFLPVGLAFSNATGAISGTPAVVSPATNYTITAYNSFSAVSATVNIQALPDAQLSSLALSSGTLVPVFAPGSITYSANVTNAASTITVTPTVHDAGATVKVNGTTVVSGSSTAAIPLNVGSNVITTVVTATDNVTTKTYTVTIIRAKSANASLSALAISAGTLTPAFSAATLSYSAAAPYVTTSITVTPVLADATATVKVNGTVVASGTATTAIPLVVGNNTITVLATAEDGTTTKTYTLTITRAAAASNTNLAALTLSSGVLSPLFAAGTITYNATVSNATIAITVTPTTSDANAVVSVNGTAVASATASGPVALTVGPNIISTKVVAQNGVTTKTYTVTITRAPSAIVTLSSLSISSGKLAPVFAAGTINYTASVVNTIPSVTLTPVTTDTAAAVTVNGTAVASGTASPPIPLSIGSNVISTVVTAQSGITRTYKVTVTRPPSAIVTLSSLSISSGKLTPVFAAATITYTASVVNSVTSITLTPVTTDAVETVTVNGTAVTSGMASQPVPLSVGSNVISTVVTAQSGIIRTYKVTVTRPPSTISTLSTLGISSGKLAPVFAAATISYTASVVNSITSVTLTPVTTDATATVMVNGTAVTSGMASPPIPLSIGSNVISTVVTAQSGIIRTYKVTVTRPPSAIVTLSALSISSGKLAPVFAAATINYTASVVNTITSVTLTPVTTDSTETVKINGTAVSSGMASQPIPLSIGPNVISTVVTAQSGTTRTYKVTVTRPPSAIVTLSSLGISPGKLAPLFAAVTINYTASVVNSVTSVTLTPVTTDAVATVTVNGTAVISGMASPPIPLSIGSNVISTVVTAQSGIIRTYKVTVTRPPIAGSIANTPALVEKFKPIEPDSANIPDPLVRPVISPNGDGINDFLKIDGIESFPENKITIMNAKGGKVFETLRYDNIMRIFDGHSDVSRAMCPQGSYFYTLQYKAGGQTKSKSGFFVLKY